MSKVYIKIHYDVRGEALCRVQRGNYQDTMLSRSWDEVTCRRCLGRVKSWNREKFGQAQENQGSEPAGQLPPEAVPRVSKNSE